MSQLVENDVLVQQAYHEFQNFTADAEMREMVRQRRRFLEGQKIFIDAARDEGWDEGIIEGKIEGIEIGEIRGEIKAILRMRFDDLSNDLVKHISMLEDIPTLVALKKLASACDTLKEFVDAVK